MEILAVIDMQNDFINGSLGTKEAEAIVAKVSEKIRAFEGKVIYTRDTHESDYLTTMEGKQLPVMHCIRDTEGWQLHDDIKVLSDGNKIFDKPSFGSISLAQYLKELNDKECISKITLIGLCTDICVITNALLIKTFLTETDICVDSSCCAGVTPESHENALSAMQMCQIAII